MVEPAAIILAAGLASRFARAGRSSKVLALHNGMPLVCHANAIAAAAGVYPRIVVAGEQFAQIAELFRSDAAVSVVQNTGFREGLASSIRCGIEALPTDGAATFIMLADMPSVSPATLAALWKRFDTGRTDAGRIDAVVPMFRERPGNPCLIGRNLFPRLLQLSGDQGAKIMLRGAAGTHYLGVDDPGILVDIDTVDDLEHLAGDDHR